VSCCAAIFSISENTVNGIDIVGHLTLIPPLTISAADPRSRQIPGHSDGLAVDAPMVEIRSSHDTAMGNPSCAAARVDAYQHFFPSNPGARKVHDGHAAESCCFTASAD
jgi:hypothetical protein